MNNQRSSAKRDAHEICQALKDRSLAENDNADKKTTARIRPFTQKKQTRRPAVQVDTLNKRNEYKQKQDTRKLQNVLKDLKAEFKTMSKDYVMCLFLLAIVNEEKPMGLTQSIEMINEETIQLCQNYTTYEESVPHKKLHQLYPLKEIKEGYRELKKERYLMQKFSARFQQLCATQGLGSLNKNSNLKQYSDTKYTCKKTFFVGAPLPKDGAIVGMRTKWAGQCAGGT